MNGMSDVQVFAWSPEYCEPSGRHETHDNPARHPGDMPLRNAHALRAALRDTYPGESAVMVHQMRTISLPRNGFTRAISGTISGKLRW